MIFSAIVASVRPRTGKTLLARLLAENFILSGGRPAIFDTDASERTLGACFPNDALVLDLDRVPDQVTLIDTLVLESAQPRVVDVAHRSFRKFFDLARDTGFMPEARSHGVEPIIFYIPSTDAESFEQGRLLHEQFEDCPFVTVENAHLGEVPSFARLGVGYRALQGVRPHLTMLPLDPALMKFVEGPKLSLSDFVRQANPELPPAAYDGIRTWLLRNFRHVYNALRNIEHARGGAAPPRREGMAG